MTAPLARILHEPAEREAGRGPSSGAGVQGFAYLSKIDLDKRELTVYEGFAYGFTLSAEPKPAPGPMTLMLIIVGALGARIVRRRRPRA